MARYQTAVVKGRQSGQHAALRLDSSQGERCPESVILNYALKSRLAEPLRSGAHLAGPAAPDLLSARGRVR